MTQSSSISEADKKILRDMRAELARVSRKVDGIRGPGVQVNSSSGIVIAQPRQVVRRAPPTATGTSATLLKITGSTSPATLGGGYYWALVQSRNSTTRTATSNLAIATNYSNAGTSTDYVIVANLLETGLSTHDIPANAYVYAFDQGETATVSSVDYAVYQGVLIAFAC